MAGVGLVGTGAGSELVMAGAGNDGSASNAISACVAGSAGKAGRGCGVSEATADPLDIAEHVSGEVRRYQIPRSRKE